MQACDYPRLDSVARLLLEWGAEIKGAGFTLSDAAMRGGSKKISRLLRSDLGGRRCEVVGMERRTDLNGMTGVADKIQNCNGKYRGNILSQCTASKTP